MNAIPDSKKYATIRIEATELPKLSESLFETLLINFQVVITEDGKDKAIAVPFKEYEKMSDTVKALEETGLGKPNKLEKL